MAKFAVIQTGGKQYLVQSNEEIVVQKILAEGATSVDLPVLAIFDTDKNDIELGDPLLKNTISASVVEDLKGEKVRISRFKSKVRFRKLKGFRPQLTKLKIGDI